MASTDLKKIHSEKRNKVRALSDVRTRASKRLKEARKSNRDAILNLHRHVENIPEVKSKKTEQEEKLIRLKAYRNEKFKRMEEQKKNQKPPFYSLVRTRHTGGTPFRASHQPLKKPVISLPPATRSRTAFQKKFEFRATATEPKEQQNGSKQITVPPKLANMKSTRNKENQSEKNNFKFTLKEPVEKSDVKQNVAVLPQKTVSRVTRSKENQMDKNNFNTKSTNFGAQKRNNGAKPKSTVPPKIIIEKLKGKPGSAKMVSYSSEQLSADVRPKSANQALNENIEKLNSIENKIQETSDILANRLAERLFVMSPLVTSKSVKRSTRRRPYPSTEPDQICEIKSQNEVEEIGKGSVEDSSSVGPNTLRNKMVEETARLNEIADFWSKRQSEGNIPEHVNDEILAVVGQTRLLLSDKFQQFGSLIDNFQTKCDNTTTVIKTDDLLGFWEMMYLEVEQLNKKFKNLDELKNNNWVPCEKVTVTNKSKKKVNKVIKSKNPTSSKFREFLKKKKGCEEEDTENTNINQFQDETYCVNDEFCSVRSSLGLLPDTPLKKTPSLMRTFTTEYRTRRSSASTITLQKSFLAKAVLSPHVNKFD